MPVHRPTFCATSRSLLSLIQAGTLALLPVHVMAESRTTQSNVDPYTEDTAPYDQTETVDNMTTLAPIVVQGVGESPGYLADVSSSATRTSTPVMELSQSVSTVTSELIRDQQQTSVFGALRNVSSVTGGENAGGAGYARTVDIRGFTVTNAITDGLASSGTLALETPTIGIERIDVVKGPESVMGGTAAKFGGFINLVSKRPQAQTFRQVQSTVDSDGRIQLGLDMTGALNESEALRGRLILSGDKKGDTDFGLKGGNDYYVAPSLGWKDAKNNLVLGFEAQNFRRPMGDYVYFMGRNISKTAFVPAFHSREDAFNYQLRRMRFDYDRDLGNAWRLSLRGQHLEQSLWGGYYQQERLSHEIDNSPFAVGGLTQQMSQRSSAIQADISKSFNLGSSVHRILVGYDYRKSKMRLDMSIRYNDPLDLARMYEPGATDVLPPVKDLLLELPVVISNLSGYHERGLSVQDQITILDNLHLKLAVRHIWFEPGYGSSAPRLSSNQPSVGAAYQITPATSIYANYMEGTDVPGNYVTSTGESLPPTEASSREIGLKQSLNDDQMIATLALFDVRKNNVPQADFDNPMTYHLVSGARSRGVEFEVNGQLTPALNVSMAYTYTSAKDDNGSRMTSGLRHALSLWSVYRFQDRLHGWNVGGGIIARSAAYQDIPNLGLTVRNPGNARVDLTAGYEAKDWSVRLGVRNLFNRTLFPVGSTYQYALVEPKRTVTLTTTLNF